MTKSPYPPASKIFITCQRIGFDPISISGFGRSSVSSVSRVPNPPASMTTFKGSPPLRAGDARPLLHHRPPVRHQNCHGRANSGIEIMLRAPAELTEHPLAVADKIWLIVRTQRQLSEAQQLGAHAHRLRDQCSKRLNPVTHAGADV